MLQTFDAPDGDDRLRAPDALEHAAPGTDAPERDRSSMEAARAFALRIVDEGGKTDAERLDLRLPPLP